MNLPPGPFRPLHAITLLTTSFAVVLAGLTGCDATSNRTVVPPLATRTLTVNTANPASGVAVTVNVADSSGASSGTASFTRTFTQSASVVLTAASNAGANVFQAWTGCKSVSGLACSVVLDADTTVTATYAPVVYTLSVNGSGLATSAPVAVSPADNNGARDGMTNFSRRYNAGIGVTLSAPSTVNYSTFSGWTGCAQATGTTCTVTVNANTAVTAAYTTPASASLTLNSANPATGVGFTVTPGDLTGAANGLSGTVRAYPVGTTVTVSAPATSGTNSFSTWTGCDSVSGSTCTVRVNANTSIVAAYVTPAQGTTYYISATSSDSNDGISVTTPYKTIQKALDKTNPGDIVYVMAGTYNNGGGSVVNMSHAGTQDKPIAIRAYPGQTPVISSAAFNIVNFKPSAAFVEFSGFTVLGNNDNVTLAQAQQYQNDPANHPELNDNCIIGDGRSGTDTQRQNHIQILNNTVGKCGGAGIGFIEADYITISGNTVFNSAWYNAYGNSAISINSSWNSDANTGYKIVITGNRLYNNQSFIPWKLQGKITDGEAIIIDTQRNSGAPGSGVTLPPYTGRTLISNNVAFNNGSSAVEVFQSDHVDVINNTSYNNDLSPAEPNRGELALHYADDIYAFNNVWYSSTGGNAIVESKSCTNCVVDYNVSFNGSNTLLNAEGTHEVKLDPKFVNATATDPVQVDLHVAASSPAVDSGIASIVSASPAPSTDAEGKSRPQGKGVDRGAYEQ